jgi:hypothetical protein
LDCPGQGQGAGSHISRRNAVSYVDDPRIGRQPVEHTVDDTNEFVEMSEVRQKADRESHRSRLGNSVEPDPHHREYEMARHPGQVGRRGAGHIMRGWRPRSIKKSHNNSPKSPR